MSKYSAPGMLAAGGAETEGVVAAAIGIIAVWAWVWLMMWEEAAATD